MWQGKVKSGNKIAFKMTVKMTKIALEKQDCTERSEVREWVYCRRAANSSRRSCKMGKGTIFVKTVSVGPLVRDTQVFFAVNVCPRHVCMLGME